MEELIRKVEQWFADRQIIENSTPLKQALKTSEEVLELQNAIVDNNLEEIKDAIGDIQVTLIGICLHYGWNIEHFYAIIEDEDLINDWLADALLLEISVNNLKTNIHVKKAKDHSVLNCLVGVNNIATLNGLTLEECLQSAYDVIIKRTGKMVNGQFVKDNSALK